MVLVIARKAADCPGQAKDQGVGECKRPKRPKEDGLDIRRAELRRETNEEQRADEG